MLSAKSYIYVPAARGRAVLVAFSWLLANVNSRSRSLFAVARPSICRLSSVTLVHLTQAVAIFGNLFTAFGTLVIHSRAPKMLWRSSQGTPPSGELDAIRVAKYSDFEPIEGYISETAQDTR